MFKELFLGLLIIASFGWMGISCPFSRKPVFSTDVARIMGLQIWQNECARRKEGLTTWNKGEDFASLGIGHFIWYPEGRPQSFKQSFPDLIAFFKSNGVLLPAWLEQAKGCPWKTKEEFDAAKNDVSLQELRELLAERIDLQILYIVRRLDRALPVLLKYAPRSKHEHLTYQFYRLAHTPGGIFVLLDYLNFKGEGTASHENYQGRGWGLLQVLQEMHGTEPGKPAVEQFIASAKKILTLRVINSPPERREERWLKGWHNRVEGYRSFAEMLDQ